MTMTVTATALTQAERAKIDELSRNQLVSSFDIARLYALMDEDPEGCRQLLRAVIKRLTKPASPPPRLVIKFESPKPVATIEDGRLEVAAQLYTQLASLSSSGPLTDVIGQRVTACLDNYAGASNNADKLERWITRAQKLLADIQRNPMFRPAPAAAGTSTNGSIRHIRPTQRYHMEPTPGRGEPVAHAGKTSKKLNDRGKSAARGGRRGKKNK